MTEMTIDVNGFIPKTCALYTVHRQTCHIGQHLAEVPFSNLDEHVKTFVLYSYDL